MGLWGYGAMGLRGYEALRGQASVRTTGSVAACPTLNASKHPH